MMKNRNSFLLFSFIINIWLVGGEEKLILLFFICFCFLILKRKRFLMCDYFYSTDMDAMAEDEDDFPIGW